MNKIFCYFVLILLILIFSCSNNIYARIIDVPLEYTTIQSAIDIANKGDIVQVYYGIYVECIIMKDGVDLIGIENTEFGKPIIKKAPGINPTVKGADNCKIEGFYLTANGTKFGVIASEDVSPTISNCYITGGNSGIYCTGSAAPIIENNQIFVNSSYGIYCTDNSNTKIRQNKILGNISNGIICASNASSLIENNLISNNGLHGIEIQGSSNLTASNNIITFNKQDGIGCWDTSTNQIENNFISSNGLNGLDCEDSTNSQILNNIVSKTVRSGVCTFGNASSTIKNNSINGNGRHGLYFENTNKSWAFNNTIINNMQSGVFYTENGNAKIENNIFMNNEYGISLWDSTLVQNVWIAYNNMWQNSYSNYFINGGGSFTPNPGTGESNKNPLFRKQNKYDFRLSEGSPCINSGDPVAEYNDIDGSKNDMGCYGGPNAGWVGPDFLMDIGSFHKLPTDADFLETDTFIPGSTIDIKMQFQNKDKITINLYIYLDTSIGNFYYPTWTPVPTQIHLTLPGGIIEYFSLLKIPVPVNQPSGEFSFGWYSINTDTGEKIFPEMEYKFTIIQKPL